MPCVYRFTAEKTLFTGERNPFGRITRKSEIDPLRSEYSARQTAAIRL
jgi:hypothetical protein